ncbi:hypothetical protein HZA33_05200 [Candidatus Pacearchaeota archaeon]|nr:hypothetical protein [Candidatus Pacearchaeota archaeon]
MSLEKYLGTLIRNLPNVNDMEFKVAFGLHSNTFLQKLVAESTIKKGVRIKRDDFYKGILFMDYYLMLEGDKICDNLILVSKALRKVEKEQENEEEDDEGLSYFDLKAIMLEAGMYSQQMNVNYKNKFDEFKTVYEKSRKADMKNAKEADLYYEAVGKMISDVVSKKRKEFLLGAESRRDLEALVFTDCILEGFNLTDETVESMLYNKKFLDASLYSLDKLRKTVTLDQLKQYMTALAKAGVENE